MAKFAKSELMKYGWTEGKGLGKNENGIKEAIKPKLKFDLQGIGHTSFEGDQWWERTFNKTAKNIMVESEPLGVSISVFDKDTTNVKPKKISKTAHYGNFIKTSLLYDTKLVTIETKYDRTKNKADNDLVFKPVTDEELFKACKGRTAHKGARHGLMLNGKLKRIKEQERTLLNSAVDISTARVHKKLKVKKHKEKVIENQCDIDNNANTILPTECPSINKNKIGIKSSSNKKKKEINDLSRLLNISCNINEMINEKYKCKISDNEADKKKQNLKRKKRKSRELKGNLNSIDGDVIEINIPKEIYDIPFPTKIKIEQISNKEQKQNPEYETTDDHKHIRNHNEEDGSSACSTCSTKKVKTLHKRKRSQNQCDSNPGIFQIDEDTCGIQHKKSKKFHHKIVVDLTDRDTNIITTFDVNSLTSDKTKMCKHSRKCTSTTKVTHASKSAAQLNGRIFKKKRSRQHRMQRKEIENLAKHLKAVHFDTK